MNWSDGREWTCHFINIAQTPYPRDAPITMARRPLALSFSRPKEAKRCRPACVKASLLVSAKGTFCCPAWHEMPGPMATLITKCQRHGIFSPSHRSAHAQCAVPLALLFSVETAARHFILGWAINVPSGQRIASERERETLRKFFTTSSGSKFAEGYHEPLGETRQPQPLCWRDRF